MHLLYSEERSYHVFTVSLRRTLSCIYYIMKKDPIMYLLYPEDVSYLSCIYYIVKMDPIMYLLYSAEGPYHAFTIL